MEALEGIRVCFRNNEKREFEMQKKES